MTNTLMRSRTRVLCLCALLSGCQSGQHVPISTPEPSDSAPHVEPEGLALLPDPQVTELTPSRYGNPASYTVAGKSYTVMDSATGYVAEGNASWYGTKFHGRRTSSGEPFDMFALTAAHKTLPIPAFARVTNLQNGRSTVVRINDRGPFHADRIIDLSYAAAVKLDFAGHGTTRVRVEVLQPAKDFYLQAGAFSTLAAADALKAKIEDLTGAAAFVVKVPGDQLYRVRIGPVRGRDEASRVQNTIASASLAKPMILGF